jgi:LPXTG-motif cell wall-anchored protein
LPNGKQGWIRNDMGVFRPLSASASKPVDLVGPERESESEAAPESEPDLPVIPESSADSVDHYQKGKELLAEHQVDDALVAFQKAAEVRPEDANVHFDLAKVYKQKNQIDDALAHFRQAQKLGRDEAKFFIEEILTANDGTPSPTVPVAPAVVPEEDWLSDWLAWVNIEMMLPALTLGGVVFLGILGFLLWRRRKNLRLGNTSGKGKQPFDAALKNVAEKKPLLRSIEEAERKRLELDEALQQRLSAFEIDSSDGRPRLPAGESSEKLLKKIDDLRKVIVNQEERAQIYSDLIVLQSEKLAALDEEVDALKKLIQIDNQTGPAKPGGGSGRQPK